MPRLPLPLKRLTKPSSIVISYFPSAGQTCFSIAQLSSQQHPALAHPHRAQAGLQYPEEKEQRLYHLNEVVNKYANFNNQEYLNKVVPVLIEGSSDKEGMLMGYTDTMKLVNVKCSKDNIGKIINVKITEAKTWSLDGEINE